MHVGRPTTYRILVAKLDIHACKKKDAQMIVLAVVPVILKLEIVNVNLGVLVLTARNQYVNNMIHCVNSVTINNVDGVRKDIM